LYIVSLISDDQKMQSFISDTLSDIFKTQNSFENTVFILPSQRAGVFVKKALQEKMSSGFLPEILNIEQFIEQVSEIHKIDTVQLLFHFYTVYKKIESKPESFDSFSSWAFTVLQDFNEVDQHLVDSRDIFNYLKDIQRLKEWDLENPMEETHLMKNHFSFMEKLGEYYTGLREYLLEKNIGYQGLMYREATKKIDSFCQKNTHKNYVLMGFNALNKAEELLFKEMLSHQKTAVYWDIDSSFLNSKHQAGSFIRKYKTDWVHYDTNPLKSESNHFSEKKNIHLIGASKNITQIKHVGEILEKFPNHNNTAVVLADETLLPITLNSLPKSVDAVNITMGYPLKDIPTTSLFTSIFQLFSTQEKLQKTSQQEFYFKDVVRFFKHPLIYQLLEIDGTNVFEEISIQIAKNNDSFISYQQLKLFLEKLEDETKTVILQLFSPFKDSLSFINRILALIQLLKEKVDSLEKEYVFRFYKIFTQLQNLQTTFKYLQNLKTIHQFFNQIISLENLSFQGEPLQGLQLMGMLETRVLDFKNVIITSVNEGVLPSGNAQASFIPFDVKIEFGLPTHSEKDAIFSYHFFRLIQRAKNVYLLYNSESDTFGGGEKSRFVSQLLHLKEGIIQSQVSPKVTTEKNETRTIYKTEAVINSLKELAQKGISPSALTNYIYNPYQFYKQKVLGIYEYEEVEETVAYNTMGTIVHDTLEALYTPYIGKVIDDKDLSVMKGKTEKLVQFYFKKHFNTKVVLTGKNKLIFEVSKRYVERFLEEEKKIVLKSTLKIIALEKKLETTITIDGFDFPIKIKGIVDRIDELNGKTRIIDYKTGLVTAGDLKVSDFSITTKNYKYSKAIQVLLYAFLHQKNAVNPTVVEGGIISFKNLKNGFLKMNFSEKRGHIDSEITTEKLNEFMEEIKELIKEIFNMNIPFTEIINERN